MDQPSGRAPRRRPPATAQSRGWRISLFVPLVGRPAARVERGIEGGAKPGGRREDSKKTCGPSIASTRNATKHSITLGPNNGARRKLLWKTTILSSAWRVSASPRSRSSRYRPTCRCPPHVRCVGANAHHRHRSTIGWATKSGANRVDKAHSTGRSLRRSRRTASNAQKKGAPPPTLIPGW